MKKRKTRTKRHTYIGEFDKYGGNGQYNEKTISIKNVCSTDGSNVESFEQHAWFVLGKNFEKFNMKPGDIIQFEASIKPYKHRNYKNKNHKAEKTRKLAWPTKVKLIDSQNTHKS